MPGRLVGNFPQAFSHVSLINSAFRLSGKDPLAPADESAPAWSPTSTTAGRPGLQRMKRLGRGRLPSPVRRRRGEPGIHRSDGSLN